MEKNVRFANSNGEMLSGILFKPKKPSENGIVICHGFRSSKYSKINMARKLCRAGFNVLIFDAAGCGHSKGKFFDHTISKYFSELQTTVRFLRKQGAKKIGVSGSSLGGLLTILYASKYKITAAVPIAAPYSLLKDRGTTTNFTGEVIDNWKRKGFRHIPVRYNSNYIKKRLSYNFVKDAKKYDVSNRKIKCPVTFIHGTADTTVPVKHAKILYRNANKPKKLILIRGANHSFLKHKKQLEKKVVEEFVTLFRSS